MLSFGIRYLNGFVAASHSADRDRVEWPPHPGRIFMALAASHFQGGADPQEREALLWLESLKEPPNILAGRETARAVVTQFVPVNDKAGPSKALLQSAPITRERQARTFARAWLENDTVWLIWPNADAAAHQGALTALCAKVTRIGHSSSLVQMWLADDDESPQPNWVPDDARAVTNLRLATEGTLHELERRFNGQSIDAYASLLVTADDPSDKKAQKFARSKLKDEFHGEPPARHRPLLSHFQGYAPAESTVGGTVARGSLFSPHLLVFRFEREDGPFRYLDLESVLAVSQRWREALCSQCNDLSEDVRSILSGHDASGGPLEGPHLAFLPLAFVDHPYADGHLLGMGLALPGGITRDLRRAALLAIGRVNKLKLGRLGAWRLEAETSHRPPVTLQPEGWTSHPIGAVHWSTVTPIAFDQHPKAKDAASYRDEAVLMIRQACDRIGLPEPREVILTPVSAHMGVPPAHTFPRLVRKDGSKRRHSHAILVFAEPVRGPILLGAGRYRGYGSCRAISPEL